MAIQPTLALIPAAQGSKFYSVLPSNGVGDFDFSRASTATRVNSKGLIEEVASGVSRLDYTGGGCPHHLLEPQSTNLIINSENFTAWSFISGGSSVVITNISNPVNSLNANLITVDSSGIYINVNTTPNANCSVSFWLNKNGQTGNLNLENAQGGGANPLGQWTINLDSLDNGFNRIYKTHPSVTANSDFVTLASGDIAPRFISASGVKSVYVTGFQLELGDYQTSYIPTSGSTVTRLAETATGSGNAATFNDSEGVLFAEISALTSVDDFRLLTINDGSLDNIILIGLRDNGTIWSTITDNTAGQFTYISNYVPINVPLKLLIKYKTNDVSFWINGFKVATSTSATIPTGLNSIDFNYGSGILPFYGNVKELQYYNTALTDLELETLTSYTSFNAMALAQNYTI